ncbi:hypothetical protein Q4519_14785 [Motilimonas sp. 1_MG-2023]|uniref:hypothetical protein n=1 Tax=Motilimonas sp. 1_MG-2023 TaxID=3062672 RepID=UPI0026E2C793|nr:hypothetical protein [Motilimonas sp. 1_MG-2023]MDO6526950.1 hypothetical protein [Motilimonas sp. 1_MG-2023]
MKKIMLTPIIAALVLSGCIGNPKTAFVEACSEIMKDRLKSPSSYQVLDSSDILYEPFTLEYWEKNNPMDKYADLDKVKFWQSMRDLAEQQEKNGNNKVAKIIIKYEAKNAYGTPIASEMLCKYETKGPEVPSDVDDFNLFEVHVNGMTKSDWLMSQIKKIR